MRRAFVHRLDALEMRSIHLLVDLDVGCNNVSEQVVLYTYACCGQRFVTKQLSLSLISSVPDLSKGVNRSNISLWCRNKLTTWWNWDWKGEWQRSSLVFNALSNRGTSQFSEMLQFILSPASFPELKGTARGHCNVLYSGHYFPLGEYTTCVLAPGRSPKQIYLTHF